MSGDDEGAVSVDRVDEAFAYAVEGWFERYADLVCPRLV